MKEKNYYVSPLCESLELQTEGVIAASKAPKKRRGRPK